MFDPQKTGKIKTTKIQLLRAELENFDYQIMHRTGKRNLAPVALSRVYSMSSNTHNLVKIHQKLGYPGISRLSYFVRAKNLPFSTEDVKSTILNCRICCEMKPTFYCQPPVVLIKSTRP